MVNKLTKEEMEVVKNSVSHWRCNCTWPIAQKCTIGAHPRCAKCGLEIDPSTSKLCGELLEVTEGVRAGAIVVFVGSHSHCISSGYREDAKEEGRKAAARIAAEVYGRRGRRPANE